MITSPFRSSTVNAEVGRRGRSNDAGVLPSAMLSTTTAKLRTRPLVASHAATRGWVDNFLTSSATTVSLSSSGGRLTDAASPPSGLAGSGLAAGAAADVAAVWLVLRCLRTTYAAIAAAISRMTATIHGPFDD